ncbi:MAG: hypothetical protein ACP5VE_15540 [Chthonomonadales bacterium]
MSPERMLLRLKQLTLEQHAATVRGDAAMLCRIAALLQPLVQGLQAACVEPSPEAQAVLLEAVEACRQAEAFLHARMRVTAASLQRISQGRRAVSAYARRTIAGARLGGVAA